MPVTVRCTPARRQEPRCRSKVSGAAIGEVASRCVTGSPGSNRGTLNPQQRPNLRWAGLRAGEVCTLPLAGHGLGRQLLTVIGKGTKQRTIPIPDVLAAHLDHYARVVRPTLPTSTLLTRVEKQVRALPRREEP